jgi:hypothetical protein
MFMLRVNDLATFVIASISLRSCSELDILIKQRKHIVPESYVGVL